MSDSDSERKHLVVTEHMIRDLSHQTNVGERREERGEISNLRGRLLPVRCLCLCWQLQLHYLIVRPAFHHT